MKMLLYPRLALTSMIKNRRLYVPYLLASAGMMMVFYIIIFLANSDFVGALPGRSVMGIILTAGWVVMVVFASIFLFYTYSFLIKRRKTEFGLYNILGMGKMNIAKILVWETFFNYTISAVVGISCGVLFSKLSELLLVRMMGGVNKYSFDVNFRAIALEIVMFACLYILILLNSLRQVRTSGAMQLLNSHNSGEKPPRANWFAAIIGTLILAAAYYIAVTVKDPILAITTFMGAVILVIIASYLLFMAGSVVLCRVLQKNKNYYYKTNHFVSVSQMAFRMRKNGAGLATICILCTMVLVTISSTACLYFGLNDILRRAHPRDVSTTIQTYNDDYYNTAVKSITAALETADGKLSNTAEYRFIPSNYMDFGVYIDDKLVDTNRALDEFSISERNYVAFIYVPLSDYNKVTGNSVSLSDNEAMIVIDGCSGDRFYLDKIKDFNGKLLDIVDYPNDFPTTTSGQELDVNEIVNRTAIVPDSVFDEIAAYHTANNKEYPVVVHDKDDNIIDSYPDVVVYRYFGVDVSGIDDETLAAVVFYAMDNDALRTGSFSDYCTIDTVASARSELFAMYTGLFFLGIVFSVVFIFVAALIMYCKQLSEGYEDKSRYDILRKVGMTKREIHSTINSQVLTVFFLPLAAAGVHTAFAFPMLSKMLLLFGDMDKNFLALVMLICFAVFALVYTAVYFVTSKTYYKIVS